MPEKNKVGTQLLLSPHTRDRARALAIVRKERVAEIYRAALEGAGLKGLERQHSIELEALNINMGKVIDEAPLLEKSKLLELMITHHWGPEKLTDPVERASILAFM